jgi:shikimate kinase
MKSDSPFIFELTGPAGAGKSTIARAILKMDPTIRSAIPPSVKEVRNIPFFTINTLRLVPVLFRLFSNDISRMDRDILVALDLLEGWTFQPNNYNQREAKKLMMDQGPVFMLSYVKLYGPAVIRSEKLRAWRKFIYSRWASTLNLIVWLDTSDSILIERVRNREKSHGIKMKTDIAAAEFLDSYRKSYEEDISILSRYNNHLKIVQIDTEQCSIEDTVKQIYSRILN